MKRILFLIGACLCAKASFAQPAISFDTVITGLANPVDIVEVNDNSHRFFVVERTGKIRIWNGTRLSTNPFLDVTSKIISSYGEQGLLSLAFHPAYATNGYFYIYYTNTGGNVTVARYSRKNDSTANDTTGKIMLVIPKLYQNHNGGKLLFGTDGYLYFGTGDGGSGGDPQNNAQTNTSLLGKMLRIDVNYTDSPYYTIPATNPFYDSITLKREIINNGLRNPWRWSFDKQTGDMWISDVGQDLWEEVNVVTPANRLNKNYGWHCFEATHVFATACTAQANNVVPIFEYGHNAATGGFSVTGGYVYRGTEYPSFQGYYIFADYSTGHLWLTRADTGNTWQTTLLPNKRTHISSFGETSAGVLYVTILDGLVMKVVANSSLPSHLLSFTGKETGDMFEIEWQVEGEEHGDVYVIENRKIGQSAFNEIARVPAVANRASNNYSLKLPLAEQNTFYRLKLVSANGAIHYSNIIFAGIKSKGRLKAYVSGSSCHVMLPANAAYIEMIDAEGKTLTKQKLNATHSFLDVPLPLTHGVIVVRGLINNQWEVVKVVY